MNNDYYIKLPNDIYDDLSITNEELTILSLLYQSYMQYKSLSLTSIYIIAEHMMMVDTSKNRKINKIIRESIDGLINKGYINDLYDVKHNKISIIKDKYFPFYVELIEPPENNYFVIYDEEIIRIFEYLKKSNLSKFNLIRYFIACKRVSNNQSNFGYLTQGKLRKLVNNSRTIQRYNRILQDDLHLIRYNNSYLTEDKHYCTTYIGKYDDEANFNNQLQIEVSSKGLIHTDKVKSNIRRRISQKINNINDSDDKDIRIKELEDQLRQLQYKPKDEIEGELFMEGVK